jgi:hypothetical protein
VANYLVYSDARYDMQSLPRDYRVAEALHLDVPEEMYFPSQGQNVEGFLSAGSDLGLGTPSSHDGLSRQERYNKWLLSQLQSHSKIHNGKNFEAFAAHLYAHIMRVCRKATKVCVARSKHGSALLESTSSSTASDSSKSRSKPQDKHSSSNTLNGSQLSLVEFSRSQDSDDDEETAEESDYEDILVPFEEEDDVADGPQTSIRSQDQLHVSGSKRKPQMKAVSENSGEVDIEDGYAFRRPSNDAVAEHGPAPKKSRQQQLQDANELKQAYVWLLKVSLTDSNLTYVER